MQDDFQKAYQTLSQQHSEIQVTTIKDRKFIWRPLTRAEYRHIRSLNLDVGEEEELICALCVLWPDNYPWSNPEKAGYPTAVCNDILIYSGFLGWEDTKALLASYEAELKDFDNMMDVAISAAFPSIRPEEPQTWTMRRALWMFSRAKWVIENIHGKKVYIFDPQAPGASPQKANQPSYHETPPDGFAPEATWWPDDLDLDNEEVPHIEGFPEID